jgi:phosphopantetheinyl transferase
MPPVPAVRPVLSLCPASQAQARLAGRLDDVLTGPEREQLGRLKSDKRRRDWLSGRLAAKDAVRRWLEERGERVSGIVEIFNDADGVPYITTETDLSPDAALSRRLRLSIAHNESGGCAAVHLGPVGIDVERIAVRDPGVLAHYARDDEDARTPRSQTRLWTIKEAVLKMLGLGFAGGLLNVKWTGGTTAALFGAAEQRRVELGIRDFAVEQWFDAETAAFSLAYDLK